MSELTARLAIYGGIDRSVVAGETPVDEAASELVPYRPTSTTPSAAGWYDALSGPAASPSDTPSDSPLPEADPAAAIAELAERPLQRSIDAEHRLRALYLARRLLSGPARPTDDAFLAALRAVVEFGRRPDEGPAPADPTGAAVQLAHMMDDRGRFSGRDGYAAMARDAQATGLLSATTAALASAVCDEGTAWFRVPGTGDLDVAAVVTSRVEVTIPERSVRELRLLFHPGRWPTCMPSFWGAMDPLPPPPPGPPPAITDPGSSAFHYREHVGDQTNDSQWFSPVLEFWYDDLWAGPPTCRSIDGFALYYGLARTVPPGEVQDPRILVDDGELSVRRSNVVDGSMTVVVRTYKKLAMRGPLPSAGLAVFACASGWADQAKALVTGCLLTPDPPADDESELCS